MNKVILMGRLTRDPEVRYSQSAEPVAVSRFSLAVDRRFKRDGEPDADFINCVAFGKTGEFVEKYFRKGQRVAVEGRLQVRSWDKDGVKQWSTEVVVENNYFADSKGATGNTDYSAQPPMDAYMDTAAKAPTKKPAAQSEGFFAIDQSIEDEDLPF